VDLKNSQINKICHFANHPYLSARRLRTAKVSYLLNKDIAKLLLLNQWVEINQPFSGCYFATLAKKAIATNEPIGGVLYQYLHHPKTS